jgi:Nif-specific regulatory protein
MPCLIWLGRVYQLKSEYFLRKGHYEKALQSAQAAQNVFSRLGAVKELAQLERGIMTKKLPDTFVNAMTEKLPYHVLLLIKKVLEDNDVPSMISRILESAREFTDMERAVLILEGNSPRIFKSASIDDESICDIYKISRSATQSAAQSDKPFICVNTAADNLLRSRPSILSNRIISIVCLPLRARDHLLGYLYLDSREGIESLPATDSLLLEIFASIVSGALSNSLLLEESTDENSELKASLGIQPDFPQMIANSKGMMDVLKIVFRLLDSDLPVLITGETGTGKELIARILHYSGRRRLHSFVAVNCPALSESLLESELFGHEKGAFTGATALKKGVFEEAKDGTLFLDEIGDLPIGMQVKFLRVLQDGEFRRVGGTQTQKTNARIVLATNQSIEELVEAGRFRQDLYYRIRVAHIHIPPLRERRDDIPGLAQFFLRAVSASTKQKIRGFSPESLELMAAYSWPGNVRQLKSEIERIVALTDNEWVLPSDFDHCIRKQVKIQKTDTSQSSFTLREVEKEVILDRLRANSWNVVRTSRSLGLTRNGLYSKMKLYNIPRKCPDNIHPQNF